jgi:hypothetical protein
MKVFISNVLFILVLFPYVSFYPIGTDIQPLIGVWSVFILFYLGFKNQLVATKIDLFFVCIAFVSILSVGFEFNYEFRKTIGILFAFCIYLSVKNVKDFFSFKVFYFSVWIYFFGAIAQIFFNSVFNTLMVYFVRAVKTDMGNRGVTVFTTEPSFLAWMAIFFIFILVYFRSHTNYVVSRFQFNTIMCLSVFLIIASKSGTGVLFGFGLLGLYGFLALKLMHKTILTCILVGGFLLILNTDVYLGRGVELLKIIILTPGLILYDTSAAVRFSQFYIGVLSMIDTPLGTGSGSFTNTAINLYNEYNVDKIIPVSSHERVEEELRSAVSAFAKYTIEIGFIFLVFIFTMVLNSSFNIFIFLYVLFSLIFSFPIVFPPVWFLFALHHRRVKIC